MTDHDDTEPGDPALAALVTARVAELRYQAVIAGGSPAAPPIPSTVPGGGWS